jgi:pyruvate dehydrogenase E1 component beta subunit
VADTSWTPYGVAAEMNRVINESDPSMLKAPSISLGMQQAPCPTAKALEDLYYPDVHDLVDAISTLHFGSKNHLVPLPPKQSMTDFYKHFKGPF